MGQALFWYTFLNLAILGAVLCFVRASRLRRARPDERQDLEENTLVRADWERVRIERCIPSRCPRVLGQPPRPRKDVTCEVCATTFLEQRLQRLLSLPTAPDPGVSEPPWSRDALSGRIGGSRAAPLEEPADVVSPPLDAAAGPTHRQRARAQEPGTRVTGRDAGGSPLGVVRVGLGLACVAVGAGAAALGGLLWLIVPGCLLVLVGLGLIASGVSLGSD